MMIFDLSNKRYYRCHIISAIDHGRLVLRDEGEKGIHSVEALNVAATVLLSSGNQYSSLINHRVT